MASHDTEKITLVVGATGRQGGATAATLIADGWRVRALVRDPGSHRAHTLSTTGAELVPGDMADVASLEQAMAGVCGVFSVQPTVSSPGVPAGFGAADKIRWGSNVGDAAARAGVEHFVYTSVGRADRDPPIRNDQNKWAIEQHIRQLGLPATVLRPVSFMENYANPPVGLVGGEFRTAINPNVAQQIIAVDDVGAFAALAFARPAAAGAGQAGPAIRQVASPAGATHVGRRTIRTRRSVLRLRS
jgi:uncharacterized protein YbjT (DUF2867 family)